jgi:amino-acid N-acetyltransferase
LLRRIAVTVEPLGPECREEVAQLLAANLLPVSDLTDRIQLLGMWRDSRLVGVIGLEPYGDVGLLRSLAVDASLRGTGLGGRLVDRLESLASSEGIGSLYLLTTTAESFFHKRGYGCVPRESAPPAIQATSQFSSICPASSAFMCKVLG